MGRAGMLPDRRSSLVGGLLHVFLRQCSWDMGPACANVKPLL